MDRSLVDVDPYRLPPAECEAHVVALLAALAELDEVIAAVTAEAVHRGTWPDIAARLRDAGFDPTPRA